MITILVPTVTPDTQKNQNTTHQETQKIKLFTPNDETEHKCGWEKFCSYSCLDFWGSIINPDFYFAAQTSHAQINSKINDKK